MSSRAHRQAAALVTFLKELPDDQLREVLTGLGVPAADQDEAIKRRQSWRYCATCGLVYPRCRAAYADDHEFAERPRAGSSGAEALREALEPSSVTP